MKRFQIKAAGQQYIGLFQTSFDAHRDALSRFGIVHVSVICLP